MKLLQIAPMVPFPPDDGGRVGIFNITKQFLLHGIDVHFAAPEANRNDDFAFSKIVPVHLLAIDSRNSYSGIAKNLFSSVPYNIEKYHSSPACHDLVSLCTDIKFDAVHVDSLHMAKYGIELKRRFSIPIVLREHNFESEIMRRYRDHSRNPAVRTFASLQHKKITQYEAATIAEFDMVLPITKDDERKLRILSPQYRSTIIPAGVDTSSVRYCDNHAQENILFLMNYEWFANRDSLDYYVSVILPAIHALRPGVTTVLVGKGTQKFIPNAGSELIRVCGFVKDINDISALGSVAVVPLRIGSGMRVKILELMAMGRVVVTTSLGAEGIDAEHGKHLLVSDDPNEFAAMVVKFLDSKQDSLRIGKNARAFIEEHYSWNSIGDRLAGVYQSLMSRAQLPSEASL